MRSKVYTAASISNIKPSRKFFVARPVESTFDRSGGEIAGLMKRTFFGRGIGDTGES